MCSYVSFLVKAVHNIDDITATLHDLGLLERRGKIRGSRSGGNPGGIFMPSFVAWRVLHVAVGLAFLDAERSQVCSSRFVL